MPFSFQHQEDGGGTKKKRKRESGVRARPSDVWLEEFKMLHPELLGLPASAVRRLASDAFKTLPISDRKRIQAEAKLRKRHLEVAQRLAALQ